MGSELRRADRALVWGQSVPCKVAAEVIDCMADGDLILSRSLHHGALTGCTSCLP